MEMKFKGKLFKEMEECYIIMGEYKEDLNKIKKLADKAWEKAGKFLESIGLEKPDIVRNDTTSDGLYYIAFTFPIVNIDTLEQSGLFDIYTTRFKLKNIKEGLNIGNQLNQLWINIPNF